MHTARMASSSDTPDGDGSSPSAWQHVDTLEVTQIVLAILEARKTMPWATAATVSRESHGAATHVRVALLDGSPSAPADHAGQVIAAFTARRLGEDLAHAFGDHDVITLK